MLDEPVSDNFETVKFAGDTDSASGRALMEVWREVSQHTSISETVARVAGIVQRYLPLQHLVVRRLDAQKSRLESIAVGPESSDALLAQGRVGYTADELNRVLDWLQSGRLIWRAGDGGGSGMAELVIPCCVNGVAAAGPLADRDGAWGVAVYVPRPGQHFDIAQLALAQSLLEPLAVAIQNDRRVHEMETMRAAAEADKQALLTKLGRRELKDSVVGAESGLRAVIDRVELVAKSDVPVLILGETGTGKEVIARLIHTRSPRANGPFLRVNCGAIPLELIDSQLFGHERGAFTGALDTRQGWFERSDGGTLLLDEIGELPPAAQVRLLRILQDGWLERVGGHTPIHVDVRIVAATHRNLAAMAEEGAFRADLWYRIGVFPISLPPLRNRVEDIADLADHFARRAAARFTLPTVLPTPEDIQLLCSYHWPGNIRELGAVIDRAAILGDGHRLEIATALGAGQGAEPPGPRPAAADVGRASEICSLDEMIKKHIEAALAATRGRIEGPQGAAALLKINPHTLRARMRKLGIDWARFRAAEPSRRAD